MEVSHIEDHNLLLNKSDLIQVKLEIELQKISKNVKIEQKRHDRLFSQLQLTKQQIELYTQESEKALEGIKDCNWRITKDLCKELRAVLSPSKTLVEICEKIMLVLEQPEKSLQGFRDLIKNFNFFKALLSSMQNKTIPDTLINEILPIWKNQTIIQAKLYKVSKCGCLLAQWINLLVEFNLKKETIQSSKRREPELEKKIKASEAILNDYEKQKCIIQEVIQGKKYEIDAMVEVAHEEFTEKFNVVRENTQGCEIFQVNKGYKGVLAVINGNVDKSREFPNFQDKDLYGENSVKPIDNQILYEGKFEDPGCCRMKFFCF